MSSIQRNLPSCLNGLFNSPLSAIYEKAYDCLSTSVTQLSEKYSSCLSLTEGEKSLKSCLLKQHVKDTYQIAYSCIPRQFLEDFLVCMRHTLYPEDKTNLPSDETPGYLTPLLIAAGVTVTAGLLWKYAKQVKKKPE